ncbi:ATP-dependent RecD-like DNA helicase [Puniceicoccales bacterium CK1056]|uniref:ATP-dependent RecD-like DNA helicase n=1 Tax=Oceanipulchritudo coccoides TaxID=2706888 RepID=A0A6B2M0B5_9BACT|nr:ATP-dependent RecD-like DNA helicase [Oceanipulchritudo coccoides]NDV61842.1 ATP-dependent RecD-like DNA helicase [Oceanipulchritudo coccoides]
MAGQGQNSPIHPDSLNGVLERIIYSNPENQFCVGELREESGLTHTVTGVMPNVQCGETLELTGNWETHRQHGRQFKVESCSSTLPASVYGIRKYLGSGLVPGIGKTYARKIVEAFGNETFDIIENHSARLREVEGIGPKRVHEIKNAWDTQRASREVMLFLQTYGVSVRNCLRLVKRYGNQAKAILLEDPYTTAREIDGIGFKTADQIARNLGFGFSSRERIEAGLLHVLKDKESEGHTALPRQFLVEEAHRLLEVEIQDIEPHLGTLVDGQHMVPAGGTDFLQLPVNQMREKTIARQVMRLKETASCLPAIKVDVAIDWAQERSRISFSPEQADGLRKALSSKISILTGGPGTGKTTILRSLVEILSAKKVRLALASPTGRAAQRLSESARHPASTLHRLLKFDPAKGGFTMNEDHPLNCHYVIIDEASMLDTGLASAMFRSIPSDAHLLLVGDVNQLPSVGAGNVLNDLIQHADIPVVRLQQVYRQREESNIVTTAHALLGGRASPPRTANSLTDLDSRWDLQFIPAPDPGECLNLIEELISKWIPQRLKRVDPIRDVQILAPMHRGVTGIRQINLTMQKRLNPGAKGVAFGDTLYSIGDRVIQTRNNYDKNIFNGDMGTVTAVHPEAGTIAVEFDGRVIDLERMELIDIDLAYAISVHKSQGSEFPVVVCPILKQHYVLLQRNLLYTAITRGRRKVFVVGDPVAWAMAVNNNEQRERFTALPLQLKPDWVPDEK